MVIVYKLNYVFINLETQQFIFGGTALRAAHEMGDYGGSAPVIPHFMRMRSIRTPENNLLPVEMQHAALYIFRFV
jgi:hypothetical protein